MYTFLLNVLLEMRKTSCYFVIFIALRQLRLIYFCIKAYLDKKIKYYLFCYLFLAEKMAHFYCVLM